MDIQEAKKERRVEQRVLTVISDATDILRNAGFKTNKHIIYYQAPRVDLEFNNPVGDILKERGRQKIHLKSFHHAHIEEKIKHHKKQKEQRMLEIPEKTPINWGSVIDTINTLPEEQQATIFNSLVGQVKAVIEPSFSTLLSPLETLKKNYTPFPENLTMSAENVLHHLETELKGFVKEHGADQDYVYLDEFRKIEPRAESIYRRLWKENKKNKSIKLLSQIIPKQTIKTQKENELNSTAFSEFDYSRNLAFTKSHPSLTPPI